MIFRNFKNIFKQNFKKRLSFLLNAICLLVLFYNAIDMTFDYLRFEFTYKLIVDDNKEGFDLPEISVCTENNILFAKTKVIQYFDVENEWQSHRIEVKKLYKPNEQNIVKGKCIYAKRFHDINLNNLNYYMDNLKWRMNYCENKFFIQYKRLVFNEMSFYEMNSITVNANDLFHYSAKIHFRQEIIDSNNTKIQNIFQTLKNIYFNEDFGICFTLLSKKYGIILKDNDHINITIKFDIQKDFLILDRSIDWGNLYMNSLRHFIWYVMVSDRHSSNRETAIELNKVGFDSRISFEMTSIELLSTPYMHYCVNNGNYPIFSYNLL